MTCRSSVSVAGPTDKQRPPAASPTFAGDRLVVLKIQGIVLHVGDCSFGNGLNFKSVTVPTLTSNIPCSGFGSNHTGGAEFLMGDGAVRFISDSISQGIAGAIGSTYQNLASINDGMPLGNF